MARLRLDLDQSAFAAEHWASVLALLASRETKVNIYIAVDNQAAITNSQAAAHALVYSVLKPSAGSPTHRLL